MRREMIVFLTGLIMVAPLALEAQLPTTRSKTLISDADVNEIQDSVAANTMRWIVDAANARCSLLRAPSADKPSVFQFSMSPASDEIHMQIAAPSDWRGPLTFPVTITLAPAQIGLSATVVNLTSDSPPHLDVFGLNASFLDNISSSSAMTVDFHGRTILSQLLPHSDNAIAALRTCNEQLLASWGIDEKVFDSLRSKPVPVGNPGSWIHNDDYPGGATGSGETVVRFTVGTDGRAADCTIVASSGDPALDEQTCRIVQRRARYSPAIAADGRIVTVPHLLSTRWYRTVG